MQIEFIKDWEQEDIWQRIQTYHFSEDQYETFQAVYSVVSEYLKPVGSYLFPVRTKEIADVIPTKATASVVAVLTLGKEIQTCMEGFILQKKLTEAYMTDCICNEIFLLLYEQMAELIRKKYHRFIRRYYFPGERIPFHCIPNLLNQLEDIGVTWQENEGLSPGKSVVLLAETTVKAQEACKGICEVCTCKNCERRKP